MTCEKQPYPNRKQARKAARALRFHRDRELRPYQCKRCNQFHLTSQGVR